MTIIKKESVDTGIPQDSRSMIQPKVITGFETCQDIRTIKSELARLKIEMDKYTKLSLEARGNDCLTVAYTDKANRAAIRYWAIRWVMGWNEMPE